MRALQAPYSNEVCVGAVLVAEVNAYRTLNVHHPHILFRATRQSGAFCGKETREDGIRNNSDMAFRVKGKIIRRLGCHTSMELIVDNFVHYEEK